MRHAIAEDSGYAHAPELGWLVDLDAAWRSPMHGTRMRAVRTSTERVRDRFADGPRAVSALTLPICTFAFPTRCALDEAPLSPAPWVLVTHRALLVQFLRRGELCTLLFNPTDDIAARATPFLDQQNRRFGDYIAFNVLSKRFESLESQLAKLGLGPNDIDYVAFNNLQHQDLRPLLGTTDNAYKARFPRAVLLVPRCEWDELDDLRPTQRDWYVRDGKLGVEIRRVVRTNGDALLGDGALLMRTPGRTSGNQTLFVNTSDGVWGASANGTCADNWSPLDSRIRGVASHCRRQDLDFLPSVYPPQFIANQYVSMMLERTLADRMARAPAFSQILPASEITPSALAPGLKPTIVHGKLAYGAVVGASRVRVDAAPAADGLPLDH